MKSNKKSKGGKIILILGIITSMIAISFLVLIYFSVIYVMKEQDYCERVATELTGENNKILPATKQEKREAGLAMITKWKRIELTFPFFIRTGHPCS